MSDETKSEGLVLRATRFEGAHAGYEAHLRASDDGWTWSLFRDPITVAYGRGTFAEASTAVRAALAAELAKPPAPERIGAWSLARAEPERWVRTCEGYELAVESIGARGWSWELTDPSSGAFGEPSDTIRQRGVTRGAAMAHAERVAGALKAAG